MNILPLGFFCTSTGYQNDHGVCSASQIKLCEKFVKYFLLQAYADFQTSVVEPVQDCSDSWRTCWCVMSCCKDVFLVQLFNCFSCFTHPQFFVFIVQSFRLCFCFLNHTRCQTDTWSDTTNILHSFISSRVNFPFKIVDFSYLLSNAVVGFFYYQNSRIFLTYLFPKNLLQG